MSETTRTIHDVAGECHLTATSSGFWNNYQATPDWKLAKIALIMSELGEAVEAIRLEDVAGLEEELADVVIRTFDLMVGLGFGVSAILKKMEKNKTRPHMHGKLI